LVEPGYFQHHLCPLPAGAGGGIAQKQTQQLVRSFLGIELGIQAAPGMAKQVKLLQVQVPGNAVDIGDIPGKGVVV
jgi:hypothetical protein